LVGVRWKGRPEGKASLHGMKAKPKRGRDCWKNKTVQPGGYIKGKRLLELFVDENRWLNSEII